jgi:hypothetical protein
MFRREAKSKRQKVKDFKSTDPKKSMMPLPPTEAQRGFGGKTVNSGICICICMRFYLSVN